GEPERALLARNLEENRLLGYQGDRDEVHDVAVQDQTPGLAALALCRMMPEERGERPVGRPRLVEPVAGPEIAAEVQVRYGEQIVRSLRERPGELASDISSGSPASRDLDVEHRRERSVSM